MADVVRRTELLHVGRIAGTKRRGRRSHYHTRWEHRAGDCGRKGQSQPRAGTVEEPHPCECKALAFARVVPSSVRRVQK